ncbi:MAG: endonuclease/exonuclease/phosphatase family protein [Pyrinomonadaceae bacterium]
MTIRIFGLLILWICLLASPLVLGQTLKVAAWNLESGGSTTPNLVSRVRSIRNVDLWGFSELRDQTVLTAITAAAATGQQGVFRGILGATGGGDRLAIVYNSTRFRLVRSEELEEINVSGTVRAPLVAKFRDTETGKQFFFMVNHLYRGSFEGRREQSRLLNNWAEGQDLPVIAVGDFNYDLNVVDPTDHDYGFDLLTLHRYSAARG